jgi:hypothetical protein
MRFGLSWLPDELLAEKLGSLHWSMGLTKF